MQTVLLECLPIDLLLFAAGLIIDSLFDCSLYFQQWDFFSK